MAIWWEALTGLQQFFAVLAIPATLILLLQTALLLFGMGGGHGDAGGQDADADADADGHDHDPDHGDGHEPGLRIFTVRAFVAFFSVFGWVGIVLTDGGLTNALSVAFAFLAGLAAMVGMAWFFKAAMRLQDSGNIDLKNALGKTGTVYIPIPPNRVGRGKVTLVVQGRFTEMDAVTDCDTALPTGSEVVGVSLSNQNVLCVVPKTK